MPMSIIKKKIITLIRINWNKILLKSMKHLEELNKLNMVKIKINKLLVLKGNLDNREPKSF